MKEEKPIVEKPIVEKPIVEELPQGVVQAKRSSLDSWKPRTELGKKVKSGEISSIDQILDKGIKILEPEIVEALIPNLSSDLFFVGQSKGKFGGGKRNIWRQTQKKTREGNKPKFATFAVVGNKDGYVGVGFGKSKETMPAREKSVRDAKLNVIKVIRGSGSWESVSKEPHSIPFAVEGKCSGSKIILMPAPKGAGLIIEKECQRLLQFAGIKDIYSKKLGKSRTKLNLIKACFNALKNLSKNKRPQ